MDPSLPLGEGLDPTLPIQGERPGSFRLGSRHDAPGNFTKTVTGSFCKIRFPLTNSLFSSFHFLSKGAPVFTVPEKRVTNLVSCAFFRIAGRMHRTGFFDPGLIDEIKEILPQMPVQNIGKLIG